QRGAAAFARRPVGADLERKRTQPPYVFSDIPVIRHHHRALEDLSSPFVPWTPRERNRRSFHPYAQAPAPHRLGVEFAVLFICFLI
ncbi:MAG: hypothetical protein NT123_21260, partial [Proteobacteria bacterium]|nr:hypothetical protein [Pseudomonadota bacterium]